jgi:putative membrane protein
LQWDGCGQAAAGAAGHRYHGYCFKLLRDFAAQRNTRSGNWFRGFNELLTPLLIAIVILAVVKPF